MLKIDITPSMGGIQGPETDFFFLFYILAISVYIRLSHVMHLNFLISTLIDEVPSLTGGEKHAWTQWMFTE